VRDYDEWRGLAKELCSSTASTDDASINRTVGYAFFNH